MSIQKPINKDIIGIDVSKDKLDVHFLSNKHSITWINSEKGLKKAVHQLKASQFSGLAVLEATGGYEKLCLQYFNKAGIPVHVAHPKRVHHFIQQKGYYGKTDKIDAKALAEYGSQESLQAQPVKDKVAQERQDLSARRAQLIEMLTAEKCRLKPFLSSNAKRSINRIINIISKEIELIEQKLKKNIESDEQLVQTAKRIKTFKGVGETISTVLLSSLPELGKLNRKEIACLCGLAPRNKDSGLSQGKRMITGGRSHVRKILYMAALTSILHNPVMKNFYQQLKQRGKPSKVALTAVMRKVIITLNAMVKDETDWEAKLS